jgi:hypothetical protein
MYVGEGKCIKIGGGDHEERRKRGRHGHRLKNNTETYLSKISWEDLD